MNLLQLIKREILITILSIVIIVSFFGLITYAYFMDIKETDLNVIKYGDIELTFCADTSCDGSISNIGRVVGRDGSGAPIFMYPQIEAEALATVPYIFKLSNTGDLGLDLTIRLEKEDNPTLASEYSDYTPADDTYIYTAFGVQGEDPVVKLYTELEDGSILLNLFLEKSETRIFNLWTWLKEDAPNEAQGTYFIADISIKGEYKLPSPLEQLSTIFNQILADNTAQSDVSINFAQPSSITNGRGLYYTEDSATYGEDNTRIYYYRGAVNNNWVSFGGYLWRIVRTTSEGGVKLAYSGDASGTSSAFINTSTKFNTSYNNKYYVGYTYNLSGYTNMPQTNSIIKGIVDTWYNTNLNSYSSYLSDTAVYCNDRSSERTDGSNIYYPAYDRLVTNKRPTYACPSTNQSRYTVSTETGNGYLQKPIALLNADEIYYSGLVFSSPSSVDSYIMENATSNHWWTMSPSSWYGSYASEVYVLSSGTLSSNNVGNTYGARASVSLKSCITVSGGNGSKSTPYVLSDSACT